MLPFTDGADGLCAGVESNFASVGGLPCQCHRIVRLPSMTKPSITYNVLLECAFSNTIKGKVTDKHQICPYSTATKNGQVFSFDIAHIEGCEVRVTCFDQIAQLHCDHVEVDAHYVISKGSIKEVNTKYNKLKNPLEIFLFDASILKHCTPDVDSSQSRSSFTPISEVVQLTNNTLVDITSFVLYVGDVITIHRKDGSQNKK
ncbi:hypothetical protein SUGI_0737480 [Cryptomeria japonica]|nr:hypothetical protein SUGI_0737480 [Cryptomeria japonica]